MRFYTKNDGFYTKNDGFYTKNDGFYTGNDGCCTKTADAIAKNVRANTQPFGGMQLIVCGDFSQLPPVMPKNVGAPFCFQTPLWDSAGLEKGTVVLETVHRQALDQTFVTLLNELRAGKCSQNTIE